jgi:hypothetical protein
MTAVRFVMLVLVLASLLACGPLDAILGTVAADSPERAAREWLEASVTMDGTQLIARTCVAQHGTVLTGGLWLSALSVLAGQQTKVDTSDLHFLTSTVTDSSAQVHVIGKIRTAVLAVAQEQDLDETWQMVWEDGKW